MVFSGDLSAGVLIGVNMLIGKIYRPTLNLVDLPSDLKKFSELLGNLKKSAGLSSEDRGSGQYHPIQGGAVSILPRKAGLRQRSRLRVAASPRTSPPWGSARPRRVLLAYQKSAGAGSMEA